MISLIVIIALLTLLAGISIGEGTKVIQSSQLETIKTNMLLIEAKAREYVEEVNFKMGPQKDATKKEAAIQEIYIEKVGLVLANGAVSARTQEGEIRKGIIEDDLVEGIVSMPTQLFYSVSIPVTLWFISKNKKQKGKVLFIDAKDLGYMSDRTHKDLSEDEIKKIADTFERFQSGMDVEEKGFSTVKTISDIAKEDYVLAPIRYVESTDDSSEFDEKRMINAAKNLKRKFDQTSQCEQELIEILKELGYEF